MNNENNNVTRKELREELREQLSVFADMIIATFTQQLREAHTALKADIDHSS